MFDINNTTIIAIDIQDKLVNMLSNGAEVKNNAAKLLKAASVLNIDTIITEQYPKGLGSTVDEIKAIKDFKTIEKTDFAAHQKPKNKNVIIFGIETHICVLQSALELIEEGYSVYVVADCSSSRSSFNHDTALEIMKQKGATILSLEIALFEFLKSSRHPNFKEVQALIK